MAEIAKIVQGNNFNVAIPLKAYILNDGEVVLQNYTPAEGDDVTIRLVGERRGYTYKPTIEGNVAHLQLSGHEVCDTYAVEVVIIGADGTMLRSYRGDQLAIVYNVDTIIADGAVEEGELYLDSQFFIQGEKGEQGDPGQDGADGRGIVSITKTATAGLVDTYTITYTDGTTSTFEVTNGKDGSGEDSLIVTLTYQSGTYIADKTYNEITAAIQAGRNVLVFSSVSQDYATFSRATSGKVEFSHIESVGSQMMGRFFVCNSNNTWATSSKTIQQELVSGTTIKTINSTSLLGSGDIAVAEEFIVNVTYSGGTYTADKTPQECCLAFLDGQRVVFANTASTPLYGDSRTFIATSVSVYNQYNQWNIYAVSGNGRFDAKVDILCYERQYTTSLTFKSIAAQVQSDWSQADNTKADFIKNKPTIPTKTSDLTNDSNFVDNAAMSAALSGKQDAIGDLADIRSGASKGATAYQKPSDGIPKSDLASAVQTSLNKADTALQSYTESDPVFSASAAAGISSSDITNWNSKTSNVGTLTGITMNGTSKGTSGVVDLGTVITEHQPLDNYATNAEYDSTAKKIYLKHGDTILSSIDATAFIKDGMVDTVAITGGNLVITFNTDSGKNAISIPISDIFNANNYYTKSDIDNAGFLTNETDPIFTASAAYGISSADITNWNSKTSNVGTITGIKMNGVSKGTSGVVDLGTVLTSYTETDPTVPNWAKQPSKPTYTASEVGALPNTTVIPSKTSDLTNDVGFVTGSKVYYGTCTTAAATNPKVVTVETFPTDGNGKPLVGTLICVKYSYTDTSTSTSPTINVNDTGDARIWMNNAVLATAKSPYHGYANRYISYMWDGTYWVWFSWGYDTNTTYTNVALGQGYATQNNASAATAITATLSSYTLTANGIVSVKFAYDVPANATLNVNSKGAKAIYHRGAAIAAGVIKAGDTATFIYSTYYHLISIDRDESADLTNYYTKTEVDTALGGKQATLVSGTNLKTVNSTSLLGSGNVSVQPTLVSGTNIKTINNESLLGSGNITIQGGEVKYTGTSGNVVTNNTTLNVAIKAIDDAIGNVETLLASI